MFDITRRIYVFQASSGENLVIYKHHTGLNLRKQNLSGKWESPKTLCEDAVLEFSACIGTEDTIHILCRNSKNNLVYIGLNTENENKVSVQTGISGAYPGIFLQGSTLHFFYIRYSKGLLLCHQEYKSGKLSDPIVLDCVKKSAKPYTISSDSCGNIFLFYIREESKEGLTVSTPGYRLIPVKETDVNPPGNFFSVYGLGKPVIQILAVIPDKSGCFHMLSEQISNRRYELTYARIKQCDESSSSFCTLASSDYPLTNSSIISKDGKIIVYWAVHDKILYCYSSDNGNKWDFRENPRSIDGRAFGCARFLPLNIDLPVNLSDNLLPAFFNSPHINLTNERIKEDLEAMESHAAIILGTLKSIALRLEDMEHTVTRMDNTLKNLEARMEAVNSSPADPPKSSPQVNEVKCNIPLIAGTGFKQVTFDYLRKTDNRELR